MDEDQEVVEEESEVNTSLKSNEEIAREVLAGQWGRGQVRKARLLAAGYDPVAVRSAVEWALKG